MPTGGHGLARCMAQCASGVAGRRAVATYAIRPQERLLRELWSSNAEADCAPQQNVSQVSGCTCRARAVHKGCQGMFQPAFGPLGGASAPQASLCGAMTRA